jgi:AbrB family looped-hinge helix DNA binding protein
MNVKISSKYQVVIPEDVRTALNLKPGLMVDVIAKGGIVYLVPVKSISAIKSQISERLGDDSQANLREKNDRR